MVKKLADKHHSAALAQLASRMSAVMRLGTVGGADPFGKVKGLIADMISKLESEAAAEAIDKAAAKSAGLKADVKELQEELAALAKEQAEMDEIRMEERADYAKAKTELEAGIAGVRKALGVLRDYYGSEGASMIQEVSDMKSMMMQPAMPEKHNKNSGAGAGIIGILEVCESDFAKNLASETTEEEDNEASYQKQTQENKVTKTTKEQDVKYSTQ